MQIIRSLKLIFLFILGGQYSSIYAKMPVPEVYHFSAPEINILPVWLDKKEKIRNIELSSDLNKGKRTSIIHYYNEYGILFKNETVRIDSKNKKKRIIQSEIIRFDSILKYQVFENKNARNSMIYDSIQFDSNHRLVYRLILHYEINLKSKIIDTIECNIFYKNDVKDNFCTYIEKARVRSEDSILILYKYYLYKDDNILKTWDKYGIDSIAYDSLKDQLLVKYYYKDQTDSIYFIGQLDSLSNGSIQYEQHFRKYHPEFNYKIHFYYDSRGNLIRKDNFQYKEYTFYLYDNINKLYSYIIMDHDTISQNQIRYLYRPVYDNWTLKE